MYLLRQYRGKQLHQRKKQYPSAMAALRYFSGKQKIFLRTLTGEGIKSVSLLQEGKLIGSLQKAEQRGATTHAAHCEALLLTLL